MTFCARNYWPSALPVRLSIRFPRPHHVEHAFLAAVVNGGGGGRMKSDVMASE